MKIVDGHKGCCEYTVQFEGLAGHGSMPDKGVNAAEYAARFVSKLMQLREILRDRAPTNSKFDPPWTTINVGRLAGGSAHNVIVSHAEVDWEMRPVSALDADWVKTTLQEFCDQTLLPEMRTIWSGANITNQTIGEILGLVPMQSNSAVRLSHSLPGKMRPIWWHLAPKPGCFSNWVSKPLFVAQDRLNRPIGRTNLSK